MAILNVGGTPVDVVHVAAQLNSQFDLPFIPESVEQAWLEWLVGKLMQVISPDLLDIIADAADGLSPEEIDQATIKLTKLVNNKIDIPVLTESMEARLIEPVVRQVLGYAVEGKALTLAGA